jgi:hypothetical protein
LFVIVALHKKPLPRWNILPFLAGFWYPALFIAWFIAFLYTGYTNNIVSNMVAGIADVMLVSMFTLQGVALAALGNTLKSDVPDETHVPA